MTRNERDIRAELDTAQEYDRTLRMNTPEYKENRFRIGMLVRELSELWDASHTELPRFTTADYESYPDSFEQLSKNRQKNSSRPAEVTNAATDRAAA